MIYRSMKIAIPGNPRKLKNYIAALAGVGLEPFATMDAADAVRCAGLLLPGGGDIDPSLYGAQNEGSRDIDLAVDEAQLAMTDAFVRAGKPILGVCKGQQVLNVYFGGGIIQHLATAMMHRGEEDVVHPCVSLPGSVQERLYGRRYAVNSMHHQAVGRLGTGLKVTSVSADDAAESLAHENLPVFAVQWHPERTGFQMARPDAVDGAEIFRYFRSLLPNK